MTNLPDPVFFDTDEDAILSDMVADYQSRTGKILSPAQAEQLLINSFAYREKMLRIAGNAAAKQLLLSFASYPVIDYLGELVGVERLPASSSECTIQFNLIAGHGAFLIPDGIRVQSIDGKVVFTTLTSVNVLDVDNSVTVTAECTTVGAIANNYKVGDISIILDPQAFVASALNIDITSGGSDQETDDALRERIRLAPSSFSTAGPEDAYIYFAKSAHPAIIDVKIDSSIPGHVEIYPLLSGGVQPSQEIIDAVLAKCNAKDVRPLNDIVTVAAPEKIDYQITVNLTLLDDADEESIVSLVTANLTAYSNKRQTNLGIDVVVSQIISLSVIQDQVYTAAVPSPAADIAVNINQFANCTGISVNVIGTTEA